MREALGEDAPPKPVLQTTESLRPEDETYVCKDEEVRNRLGLG